MRWVDALKEYNAKKGMWCIPKKGSPEHAEVMAIMKGPSHEEKEHTAKREEAKRKLKERVAAKKAKNDSADTREAIYAKLIQMAARGVDMDTSYEYSKSKGYAKMEKDYIESLVKKMEEDAKAKGLDKKKTITGTSYTHLRDFEIRILNDTHNQMRAIGLTFKKDLVKLTAEELRHIIQAYSLITGKKFHTPNLLSSKLVALIRDNNMLEALKQE